jgi:asparagine synthase (glutamine-hydrolysing)
LSIYQPANHELILAKDFVGVLPLYYRLTSAGVTWSSSLEALLLETRELSLSEEYVAAWFTHFPAPHHTPYREIHAVPPGSFVRIVNGRTSTHTYWTFDRAPNIRYKRDEEYEEHFRQVFQESVRRRLRSSRPVVAELSGGMDSSAIVCVADTLISSGAADVPRLDTLSRFDPSDPDWNEQRYFSLVEQKRGRAGSHVDVSQKTRSLPEYRSEDFAAIPAAITDSSGASIQIIETLLAQGNRAILSGTGGDELLGGIATPTPELADLLVRFQFAAFIRQTVAWSLTWKRPMLGLVLETMREFLPLGTFTRDSRRRPPEWIEPRFARRNRTALSAFHRNFRIVGPLPSFQSNLDALDSLRRQLASVAPLCPPFEMRYPYLDRDLWTFVCGIPCQQLLRPRQRRSLMRRALAGIVPAEIIGRPNKGFVARGRMLALSMHWPFLDKLTQDMITAALGMVDAKIFRKTLERARIGQPVPLVAIYRTLTVECWLRHVAQRVRLGAWSRSSSISPDVPSSNRMSPAEVSS